MTNADQPNARFNDIDTRLEEIGDELDLLLPVQNANRRETRGKSQTIARKRGDCSRTERYCPTSPTSS